ncbi:hypothetical protein [Pedobacter punctiformis]|uniref:Outer membrane lipoprotein-sorting protein n=1 Tax=Pedobacter punctiformis TaxID=3004097 RepID=A0ABT4L8D9_9SPHI|nr:hypothetical protein [Pedobacter sp. HCMS5-2]MCZ4244165.1 hypothetical protein [Pedobacter sp. HCMS5-2]
MKSKIYLFLLLTFFNASLLYSQSTKFVWGEKEKLEKIKKLQDSTQWDKEMLLGDLNQIRPKLEQEGMNFGVFPAAKYKQGLGTGSSAERNFFGKTLYWNYFFGEKNIVNQEYLKDKKSEVFFAIVILTDTLNFSNEKYNMSYNVVSRNYPDKLGNGILKTKNNSVEYTAFLTGDRKQFALVNLRLFDLDQGRLILIAPQKDGSLRSKQIKMPLLEFENINEYVRSVIKENDVKKFFMDFGNI